MVVVVAAAAAAAVTSVGQRRPLRVCVHDAVHWFVNAERLSFGLIIAAMNVCHLV